MSAIDFLSLVDSCMCTSIRKIARIITRIYDSHLEPSGLTINQLGLLLTIKGQNELNELSSVGTIGQRLVMEKSTLSRNMRRLEDLGFITIETDPTNRTQKQARVTSKGLETVLDAYKYWDEVQNRIRTKLGKDQFEQLLGLLNLLQNELLLELDTDFV